MSFIDLVLKEFIVQKPKMGPYYLKIDKIDSEITPDESIVKRYEEKKEKNTNVEEKIVYHGTYEENIQDIFRYGFKIDKAESRMPGHFGKGIYTSRKIDVSTYYCYGGINPKNAYTEERAEHKLIACKILVIKEYKTKEYCMGWKPENLYETFTFDSEHPWDSPQTVIYKEENIQPLFVIHTKDVSK